LTPQELETTLYSGVIREVENIKKLISEEDEVNRKRKRRDADTRGRAIDAVEGALNKVKESKRNEIDSNVEYDESKLRESLKQRVAKGKDIEANPVVDDRVRGSSSISRDTTKESSDSTARNTSERAPPAPTAKPKQAVVSSSDSTARKTSETARSSSSSTASSEAREGANKNKVKDTTKPTETPPPSSASSIASLSEKRETTSEIVRESVISNSSASKSRDLRHKFVDTIVNNIDENEERSEVIDKIDGLKTVDINKIKEGYETIRNSTFKIQKKTFGKGEIFNKHSDLRERWIQNPKKDWKSLEELLKIMGQREPRIYPNREQSIRAHQEYRNKIIAELAEEGSEFRIELSNLINDQAQFFRVLNDENFTRRPSRYLNLSRLNQYEFESNRMLELVSAIKFEYLEDIRRFCLKISDPNVSEVYLSDQICYVLGFDVGSPIKNGDIAKYACDLRGGVSHICVYANGVTDQMIVGDKLASLLQIVAVTGAPGDVIEKKYDAPLFNKVISKNIDEIEIEIRTLEGRLVPFDYGVVILTLIFKKLILF